MSEARRSTDERQIELADAALRIIATKGIAALSTRSLAEAVGLSTGAIFRHFSSIDAVLEAVVARVESLLDETYPPADLPPLERLETFVQARIVTVGPLGLHRLVTSEQFQLALPPASAERLGRCVQRSRAFIADCLHEGQAAGTIRDDIPVPALAPLVMGAVQALALASASSLQFRGVDADAVRAALFTLLRPPREKRRRPAR